MWTENHQEVPLWFTSTSCRAKNIKHPTQPILLQAVLLQMSVWNKTIIIICLNGKTRCTLNTLNVVNHKSNFTMNKTCKNPRLLLSFITIGIYEVCETRDRKWEKFFPKKRVLIFLLMLRWPEKEKSAKLWYNIDSLNDERMMIRQETREESTYRTSRLEVPFFSRMVLFGSKRNLEMCLNSILLKGIPYTNTHDSISHIVLPILCVQMHKNGNERGKEDISDERVTGIVRGYAVTSCDVNQRSLYLQQNTACWFSSDFSLIFCNTTCLVNPSNNISLQLLVKEARF